MTSPTPPVRPARQPISARITRRLSPSRDGRHVDSEARHTRNVTLAFYVLFGTVLLVIAIALLYGYWEANLKPLANVDGTEVGRNQWQDRQKLEELRAERGETAVRSALAQGSMDADLGNRRLAALSSELADGESGAMDTLVDLLYQEQLAADRGITLSQDELETALAEDGTLPASRRVGALVILSDEQQVGLPETSETRAAARAEAEAALAALQSGTPVADLVEEHSPATASTDGDLGWVTEDDIPDPVWAEAVWALDEGGITDIVEVPSGEYLIGVVTGVAEALTDPGFRDAAASALGTETYERQVELEALAAKLEDVVTNDALRTEYEQVQLAEILIAGDTTADPETDEGSIRARHILYQPEAEPNEDGTAVPVAEIPEDDPAWDTAKAEADAAAADLRAVSDIEARVTAFAERAEAEGDDSTAQTGGDLGFFAREAMVPAFSDALFDAEGLVHGDIIGPVRSEFGWHVIMFDDARAPIAERLEQVKAALAQDGAEFAAIAAEHSDGPEASKGGEIGWQVTDDLDDLAVAALTAVEVGETTEPIDDPRGWAIYQKLAEATQVLEPDVAARRAQTAFTDWYDEQKFAAEDEGRISIDDSVYE